MTGRRSAENADITSCNGAGKELCVYMNSYIQGEYDKARVCLWGPEHGDWMRNDIDGYYHLWNAYREAIEAEDIDHLLFAVFSI